MLVAYSTRYGFGQWFLWLCGTGFVPVGLVAADVWEGTDRFTLYGYAAAGYNAFISLLTLIMLREVPNPLRQNAMYLLEFLLSLVLLITLWLYRQNGKGYWL